MYDVLENVEAFVLEGELQCPVCEDSCVHQEDNNFYCMRCSSSWTIMAEEYKQYG